MIDWITANGPVMLEATVYVIAAASIIVKLTPNETDNEVVKKIVQIAEKLGLNTEPVK